MLFLRWGNAGWSPTLFSTVSARAAEAKEELYQEIKQWAVVPSEAGLVALAEQEARDAQKLCITMLRMLHHATCCSHPLQGSHGTLQCRPGRSLAGTGAQGV